MGAQILLASEYARCRDELKPGQLKRVPMRGQCVGVFLRCPECAALLAFPAEAVELVENAASPPCPISLSGGSCRSCGSRIFTREGYLCAEKAW